MLRFKKLAACMAAACVLAVTAHANVNVTLSADDLARARILAQAMDKTLDTLELDTAMILADTGSSHYQRTAAQRLNLLGNRIEIFEQALTNNTDASTAFTGMMAAYLGALEYAAWVQTRPVFHTELAKLQTSMNELVSFYGDFPEYRSQEYTQIVTEDPQIRELTIIVPRPQPETVVIVQPQPEAFVQVQQLSTQLSQLEALSDALEKATDEVAKGAQVHSAGLNRHKWENMAARRLSIFENRADKFKKAVEKASSIESTRKEFAELLSAYATAVETYRWVYDRNTTEADFLKAQNIMDTLVTHYGGYGAFDNIALHMDVDDGQTDHEPDDEGDVEGANADH